MRLSIQASPGLGFYQIDNQAWHDLGSLKPRKFENWMFGDWNLQVPGRSAAEYDLAAGATSTPRRALFGHPVALVGPIRLKRYLARAPASRLLFLPAAQVRTEPLERRNAIHSIAI